MALAQQDDACRELVELGSDVRGEQDGAALIAGGSHTIAKEA